MSSGPAPMAPLEDRAAVFLHEHAESWTGERLLRLAAAMRSAALDRGDTLGVSSPSAAFVIAAALVCWSLRRDLIVLDPSLKREPDTIHHRFPGLPVLVDEPGRAVSNALVVSTDRGAALEPTWPEPGQTAAVFLTSGSSGEPKLVRKRSYQLLSQLDQELTWLGLQSGLSVYSLVPPFHILGFVYGLFLPLLGRGQAQFTPAALPTAWIERLRHTKPDLVVGVPHHFRALAHHTDGTLPAAFYFSSGAPLTPAVHQAFEERTGQSIVQMYGSTETGGIAKRVGFGAWHPFPGLEWRIGDDDGRLAVRAPWQEEPSEWWVTDDIVAEDDDGFRLIGRADSVVKVAGNRFSTDEVVSAVLSMPEVQDAAAVTYDRYEEQAVALIVVPAAGSRPTAAQIRAALAGRLAAFKLPRTIRLLETIPTLASGKANLEALRALVAATRMDM